MHLRPANLGALLVLSSVLIASDAGAARKADKPTAKQTEPLAQDTPLDNLKDAPQPSALACTGPFAKDTTHAKLVAEFGAKNVAFKDVDTPGNILEKATVIFDDDPSRRVVVFWSDARTRTKPSSVAIEAPSTWTGPGGVRNGLPLKELEKLNGGAFSMIAFGGVGGGTVSGLKGALADIPGDCTLKIRFEPGIANPLPPRFASITGEQTLTSANLLLRRVRPQVSAWSVNYR